MDEEFATVCQKVKDSLDKKAIKNQQVQQIDPRLRTTKELHKITENPEDFKKTYNKISTKLKVLEKNRKDKKSFEFNEKKNRRTTLNTIQEVYEGKCTGAMNQYSRQNLKAITKLLLDEEQPLREKFEEFQQRKQQIRKDFPYKQKQFDIKKCQRLTKVISEDKIELSHKINLSSMEIRYLERDAKKLLKTSTF